MGNLGAVGGLRIGALVFGLLVLAVAYVGSSFSSWLVGCTSQIGNACGLNLPYYERCKLGDQPDMTKGPPYDAKVAASEVKSCPSPMMEKLFIVILGNAFIVTIVFLILSCLSKPGGKWHGCIQKSEFGYDLVAAVLLVLGAILFLASAVMINNIYSMEYESDFNERAAAGGALLGITTKIEFYFIVKLVAAILGLGLAALYVVLALKIRKARKEEAANNAAAAGMYAETEQYPTQDEVNRLSQNPSAAGPPPE